MRSNWDQVNESSMTTAIGIDPGQRTGIAVYRDGALCELRTLSPDQLESVLADLAPALVVLEDSRLGPVYARSKVTARAMGRIARSVGEIDQRCREIEDLCRREEIEIICVSPRGKGRKLNAAEFAALTGWTGRTNQHVRDAVCVSWPYRNYA